MVSSTIHLACSEHFATVNEVDALVFGRMKRGFICAACDFNASVVETSTTLRTHKRLAGIIAPQDCRRLKMKVTWCKVSQSL